MKSLSVFIFLSTFFNFFHHSQSHRPHFNNSTDEDALLNFKSAVTRDPNGVLDSWNPNSSFCKWHGVLCNPIKNRVLGLKLGDYSLTGTISPHLTNLSLLQILDLHNNTFSGEIPADLHLLFRLKFLDLSFNNIHGHIPPSLSGCLNLRVINFSHNSFHGKIPSEISQLSNLQFLKFGNNNISGEIPSSFGNLSSLTLLRLTSNNIRGPIPPELGLLHNLQALQIGINNLSGEFPTELLNISSIVQLNLAVNRISGTLPAEFFTSFPYLASLQMAGNSLNGFVPSSLSNASELEDLDMSANRFSGRIPLLWKLGKIQYLNLEENNLTSEIGDGGLDFITSLTNSTFLQTLSVSKNQLTGQLPSSIGNLSSQLWRLYMGANQLHGVIPQELGNLGNLAMIQFESNFFTEKIPSSLGNLRNLKSLMLSNNFLSGSIPKSLGNLTKIFALALEGNNLSGELPWIFSNFGSLNYLNLGGNGFTGQIPKELFTITGLGFLNVSSNKLSGFLHSEIGNLNMLQYLDISFNGLSGPIPSAIGDCSNLEEMLLSDNSFRGPIPITITNLRGILFIDLSSNELSGEIPPLGSLPYLQSLNLSSNNLRGEVPKNGVFLNTSAVSLSQNPDLCGGISQLGLPKCRPFRKSNKKEKLTIGIAAGVTAVGVPLIALFCYLIWRRKKPAGPEAAAVISFEGPHRRYSFNELKAGTGNFSEENVIGRGSFGAVYRGVMRDGTLAAVKVLDMDQSGAVKSFLAECEAFRNVRHRNLVKILSACSGGDFKALVLKYMANGSLENWIHRKREGEGGNGLSLKQRIGIALDVASAMEYLHHGCEAPIVHCDLKPSNVLLDEDMVAHVGDFGLARILQNRDHLSTHQQNSTIALKGSIGYIAPEYGFSATVSTKGDVYSYGILLLEMFVEKKPTDEMFSKELNMQRWVATSLPSIVMEIFQEELEEAYDVRVTDHLVSLVKLGLRCASESSNERPDMKEVVASIKKTHPLF